MPKLAENLISSPDHNGILNALQDAGIVSDNCVTLADVADADFDRARAWLAENYFARPGKI